MYFKGSMWLYYKLLLRLIQLKQEFTPQTLVLTEQTRSDLDSRMNQDQTNNDTTQPILCGFDYEFPKLQEQITNSTSSVLQVKNFKNQVLLQALVETLQVTLQHDRVNSRNLCYNNCAKKISQLVIILKRKKILGYIMKVTTASPTLDLSRDLQLFLSRQCIAEIIEASSNLH